MSAERELPEPIKARTMDALWRSALGAELRRMRNSRGERLDDTAARAGISPQYLSEIERGRKDASSEMIAAVVGALESSLAEVLIRVADGLVTRSAEVIDIRTSIAVSAATRTATPRMSGRFDATLSIAA